MTIDFDKTPSQSRTRSHDQSKESYQSQIKPD